MLQVPNHDYLNSIPRSIHKHERVGICICTCKRPMMLGNCLRSLGRMIIPANIEPYIIIIDNDPNGGAYEAIASFGGISPHLVFALHEPRRGIARARNAALGAAEAMGMDWIAFIDDDETADEGWLAALMAHEYRHVPVLMGRQMPIYPSPLPFWAVPRERRARPEGRRLDCAYTNNVRFSIDLVKAGLRFDERLGLMGGEDSEFFYAAHRAGFEIRQTQRALTYEVMHPARLSYIAQSQRAYWIAASNLRRGIMARGKARTALTKLHTIPVSMALGAIELAISPLFAVAGLRRFKRRAIAGGANIAKGMGRIAAMLGRLPEPYKHVVGE